MKIYYSWYCLKRHFSKSLILGALSTLGVFSGFAINLSEGSHNLSLIAPAAAQSARPPILNADVSNDEVTNYAKAVLEMEPLRQQAYNDVKQLVGAGDVPPIVCFQEKSMQNLPTNARPVVERFCNRSKEIIEKYFGANQAGSQRYNDITTAISGDNPPNPSLQQRIQNELIRLQKTDQ